MTATRPNQGDNASAHASLRNPQAAPSSTRQSCYCMRCIRRHNNPKTRLQVVISRKSALFLELRLPWACCRHYVGSGMLGIMKRLPCPGRPLEWNTFGPVPRPVKGQAIVCTESADCHASAECRGRQCVRKVKMATPRQSVSFCEK